MKKLLILLIISLFVCTPAMAAYDASLCPQPPYPVSSGVSKLISNITGTNFLLTTIGEKVLENQLKKDLGAKFDIQIYPFGGKNLIDGKFRKMTAEAHNVVINGLHITSVKSESVCDYNHFVKIGDDVYSAENFLSKFNVIVTSDDLQRTLASSEYTKMLNSMNMSFNNFVLFKVFDPVASIKDNRIDLSLKLVSPLVHAGNVRTVSMSMGLGVVDGQIKFTDVKLRENSSNVNINAILPIINRLNPFMYETTILKTKGSVVRINNIKIEDNKILIDGIVFIPKRYGL